MKSKLVLTVHVVFASCCGSPSSRRPRLARPAPQTAAGDMLDPRTYAPDSRLFLVAYATGVQKYTCQANGTWLFTDPEATLLQTGATKPIGTTS